MNDILLNYLQSGHELTIRFEATGMGDFWAEIEIHGQEFFGIGSTPEDAIEDLESDIENGVSYSEPND